MKALVVLDYQNDLVDEKGKGAGFGIAEHAKIQNAVQNTAELIKKMDKVIYVTVSFDKGSPEIEGNKTALFQGVKQAGMLEKGTWGAQIHENLGSGIIINKTRISPFTNPKFEEALKGVDTLILAGVATNFVVEATAREAADKDYEVIVAEDCCASMNQEMHDFSIKNILPNIAKVVYSRDL